MAADTQGSRKKMKVWMQEIDTRSQDPLGKVECDLSLQNVIERKLHQNTTIPLQELNLDHILSQFPYKSILENMMSQTNKTSETEYVLPTISKNYEESFMRQARPSENPCVFGPNCECNMIDPCAPFTAVEFRLYGDPPEPQMCVVCSRKTTQKLFYDMCCSGTAPNCVIQRYGNIFGVPGEYAVECMLVCPQGFSLHCMPLPIMSHQRNKYSVTTIGGLKHLVQHRVSFEHFETPSGAQQS